MSLLKEVSVVPRITNFTFDLPFPGSHLQLSEPEALRRRIANWIAEHTLIGGSNQQPAELDYSNGRVAQVSLIDDGPGGHLTLRLSLSLEDIEVTDLKNLGELLRAVVGGDFSSMCARAHAAAMTVDVYLWDVTFERTLPRFKATGGQAVEEREYDKRGFVQRIQFKSVPVAGTRYRWGESSLFDSADPRTAATYAPCIASGLEVSQAVDEGGDSPALMLLSQKYRLNLPIARLNEIQGNLHRVSFAEDPFASKPKLSKAQVKEFFSLIKTEGIDAAMAKARWYDGGLATRNWWKSRQAEWWNPAEVWDECVADLPLIGNFIASGFTRY